MTPESARVALGRRGLEATLVEERAASPLAGGDRPDPRPTGLACEVAPARLLEVLGWARDELGFDLLSAVTATDEGDHFRLLYHLARAGRGGDPEWPGHLLVSVRARRGEHPDGPLVASAVAVYPGANLQEREIFDLMGVRFRGHPNLTRVLTWEGFTGHPLRKDYVAVDEEIPWRLAGLRGPDGSLVDDIDPGAAGGAGPAGAGVWEPVALDQGLAADAPLADAPPSRSGPEVGE